MSKLTPNPISAQPMMPLRPGMSRLQPALMPLTIRIVSTNATKARGGYGLGNNNESASTWAL